ncbi:MAG: phosphotransferase [Scrofimicrobium sp.]
MSSKAVPASPSALELAALANAIVPGLQALGAKDYVAAEGGAIVTIVDDKGQDWQIWSTSSSLSKDEAERLLQVLGLLDGYVSVRKLPFGVPVPAGVLRQKSGTLVLVYPHMGGEPGVDGYLNGAGALASTVGKALGQLHNLPSDAYFEATGRLSTPEENRKQIIGLVQQHSSVLPADLRTRWMGALKDSALWQADSTPIHGILSAHDLQVAHGGAVLGMRGFTGARVDDPALDLLWLMYGADDAFLESFEAAYSRARTTRDLHLLTRAQLYAEIETLKWYDQAVQADDPTWRKAGVSALRALDKDLAGELLVAPKEEVVEIKFTAEDEPLLKLGVSTNPANPTGATVAGVELEEQS